jgi:hypothetical protein
MLTSVMMQLDVEESDLHETRFRSQFRIFYATQLSLNFVTFCTFIWMSVRIYIGGSSEVPHDNILMESAT